MLSYRVRPTHTRLGQRRLAEQAIGCGMYGRVGIGSLGHKGTGLLRAQAVRPKHSADAPATHRVTFGLHFGADSSRAIPLAVVRKHLAHGGLPGRFWSQLALLSGPGVVCAGCDLQDVAELAHQYPAGPQGNVLINAHRAGWSKMTKTFISVELLGQPLIDGPLGPYLRVVNHYDATYPSHELCLLLAVEQLGADA